MPTSNQQARLRIGNIAFALLLALSLLLGPASNPVSAQSGICAAGERMEELNPTNPVPSQGLQQGLQQWNPTYANFGDTAPNRFVAHTFDLSALAPRITQAWLETELLPVEDLASNDAIALTFFDNSGSQNPPGWARRIGTSGNVAGLLQNIWGAANYPGWQTFTLTLNSLPQASGPVTDLIPTINSQGFLDFYVQDDTSVHSLKLTLCVTLNPCPADVMLVMDQSESMNLDGPPSRMDAAKSAAVTFLQGLNPATDRAGLVSFNGRALLHNPPGLTNNLVAVQNAVTALTVPPGGGTDMAAGIDSARTVLTANLRLNIPQVILLLTDGNQDGPEQVAKDAATLAKNNNIRIIVIGLGTTVNTNLLQNHIATTSSDYYPSATVGLSGVFGEILQSLCLQLDPICDGTTGYRVTGITTSGATPWNQPNNALIDEQGNSSWWTAWGPGYPNSHYGIVTMPNTVNIHEVRAHASSLQGSSGTLDVKVNGTTYALNLINPGTWDSFVSFSPPISASQVELTRNSNTANIDELYLCGSMAP